MPATMTAGAPAKRLLPIRVTRVTARDHGLEEIGQNVNSTPVNGYFATQRVRRLIATPAATVPLTAPATAAVNSPTRAALRPVR